MPHWIAALRTNVRGRVHDSLDELAGRSRDFGGMVERLPRAVLEPADEVDLQTAVRVAGQHGVPVTVRGAGHSQAGQGLGQGLVVDMTGLARVHVDPATRSVEAQGGALWRSVVDACHPFGLLPVSLTHAMDTTVGGTLSVAGVGAESHAYGPQVDNVLALDVLTSAGDLVRCSADCERPLFDAVRAGLGECGIIVRAVYPLRASGASLHTRAFLFRESSDLLKAIALLTEESAGRLLAVRLAPDPLAAVPLVAALFVGEELTSQRAERPLPELPSAFEAPAQVTPTWTPDGVPGHPFFRVFLVPSADRPSDRPVLNPWVDTLFPPAALPAALAALADAPGALLRHGPAEIIPVRRGRCPAPLFITPTSELSLGLGMYATFPAERHAEAASLAEAYAQRLVGLGGKRYLAGYFGATSHRDWGVHFGERWRWFCRAKQALDPRQLFSRGFIRWPEYDAPPHAGK